MKVYCQPSNPVANHNRQSLSDVESKFGERVLIASGIPIRFIEPKCVSLIMSGGLGLRSTLD